MDVFAFDSGEIDLADNARYAVTRSLAAAVSEWLGS